MSLLKTLILLAASGWLAAPLRAQLVEVQLQNGHALRGQMVANHDCSGVRITVLTGDTICVPFQQYAAIKFRRSRNTTDYTPVHDSTFIPKNKAALRIHRKLQRFSAPAAPARGIYKRISLSSSLVTLGNVDRSWRSAVQGSVWLEGGYRFSERWALGLATGFDDLPVDQIPLLASVRWRTSNGTNSYFLQAQAGYGFLADKLLRELPNRHWYRGGFAAYPAAGYEWATFRRTHWSIDVGYKFNQFVREETRDDYFARTNIDYRRWTLRLGIAF